MASKVPLGVIAYYLGFHGSKGCPIGGLSFRPAATRARAGNSDGGRDGASLAGSQTQGTLPASYLLARVNGGIK
jgi:hypothetical protein